jgi:hypothetical protein
LNKTNARKENHHEYRSTSLHDSDLAMRRAPSLGKESLSRQFGTISSQNQPVNIPKIGAESLAMATTSIGPAALGYNSLPYCFQGDFKSLASSSSYIGLRGVGLAGY